MSQPHSTMPSCIVAGASLAANCRVELPAPQPRSPSSSELDLRTFKEKF